MTKTPEEIKKGLECCNTYNDCQSCPYDDKVEKGWGCCVQRNADALAYIQQLEARLVETNKTLDDLKARLAEYEKPLEPLVVGFLLEASPVWIEYRNGIVEVCDITMSQFGCYYTNFIGYEEAERHERADYNKTWRCWSRKPTEEERKAAKWDD